MIEAGGSVALMGASGSGKSSLLHCLAGVLVPDQGSVLVDGTDISGLRGSERSRLRLERMGVVLQYGDLVPELTLVEDEEAQMSQQRRVSSQPGSAGSGPAARRAFVHLAGGRGAVSSDALLDGPSVVRSSRPVRMAATARSAASSAPST